MREDEIEKKDEALKAKYSAYWECPKCTQKIYEHDDGIDNLDDRFVVICQENVEESDGNYRICGHHYDVLK